MGTARTARAIAHVRRNFVAYLALFIALGGTSYAASQLPKNSVGTKQLKKKAVTKPKLAKSAIKALSGKRGPQGVPGPLPPSKSASVDPNPDVTLTNSDQVLMTATIKTDRKSRIFANGIGEFAGSGNPEVDCVMNITPPGGSPAPMGQRFQLEYFIGLHLPSPAAGAKVEPAGTYKVDFACKNDNTSGSQSAAFQHGEMGLNAMAP